MVAERPQARPRILGLTGGIASGKSTVGEMLVGLGALRHIDADKVIHQLMRHGSPTAAAIGKRFGGEVLRPDGSVDRERLGGLVFADREALADLEDLTHPAVREVIRSDIEALDGSEGVVVLDAVKLLQGELLKLCDAVWVVRTDPEVQLRRLTTNRGMSQHDALSRIHAQPSFDSPAVTAVIDNSGSLDALGARVRSLWEAQLQAWAAPKHLAD